LFANKHCAIKSIELIDFIGINELSTLCSIPQAPGMQP
jgi:hypothetical protein